MKLLIISGSPRRKDSHGLCKRLVELLQTTDTLELEEIRLCKRHIDPCCGCLACMRKGEEACPCKDELTAIVRSMQQADAVIFAAPVYVHGLPAPMKNLFDRLAWCLHRPAFHGKPALLLSTTELSGLSETLKQLAFPLRIMGFHILGRIGVLSAAFAEEGPYRSRVIRQLERAAAALTQAVAQPVLPRPRLSDLVFFHKLRTKIRMHREKYVADYNYWSEQGWLNADYFYPVKTNAFRRLLAAIPARIIRLVLRLKLGKQVFVSFTGGAFSTGVHKNA